MFDINKLSSKYTVRFLNENDIALIINLCKENKVFYEHTNARPNKENISYDMKATPPGVDIKDKYYIGFFDNNTLIAIMDLIDGWPTKDTAYIGFFMMNIFYQGKNIGSSIIKEVESYLKEVGMNTLRLAIDDGNPQSTHFWHKCGFKIIKSVDVDGYKKHIAEKHIKY